MYTADCMYVARKGYKNNQLCFRFFAVPLAPSLGIAGLGTSRN